MISLKDIARICDVSESTVSKALKGHRAIKAATRERIQMVAQQNHYQPNAIVQSIQTGRSRTIGIAYNNFYDVFAGAVLAGVHHELHGRGYDSMVICWDMIVADKGEVLSRFARRRVDGLLLFPMSKLPTPFYLNELRSFHSPVVTIDQTWPGNEFAFVGSDNRGGADLAVSHLIERGITELGIISCPGISSGQERHAGFLETMARHGLAVRGEWCIDIGDCLNDAYDRIRALLSLANRPRGLVCFNDYLAFDAAAAAHDLGIRIPEDLSLVGFGDLSLCTRMRPKLTTVAQNPEMIGRQAARLLLDVIASKPMHLEPTEIRVPVKLIIRDSVL